MMKSLGVLLTCAIVCCAAPAPKSRITSPLTFSEMVGKWRYYNNNKNEVCELTLENDKTFILVKGVLDRDDRLIVKSSKTGNWAVEKESVVLFEPWLTRYCVFIRKSQNTNKVNRFDAYDTNKAFLYSVMFHKLH